MSDSVYRHPYRRPPILRRFLPAIVVSGPVLLEDDFDDNSTDAAKWTLGSIAFENAGVGVDEVNQQLEISPLPLTGTPAIYGYKSLNTYDFTAREASIRIAADIDPNTEAWLVVALDADNYLRTWVASGNIQTRSRTGATNSNQNHGTFNFAAHTYWRIRHDDDSDEIVWEYSADGLEWIELRRLARPITITSMSVYLSGGTGSSIASPGLVKFDDFNLRTPAAFNTVSRSASLSATASVETAAQSFSVIERTAAISATADISTSATHFSILERAVTLDATALITVSGLRIVERSVAVSATATVTVSGARVVDRSVVIDGSASVESSAISFSVTERTASVSASASVEVAGLHIVERSSSLTATASIESTGISFSVVSSAAQFDASATIQSSAEFFSIFERQLAIDATATITTSRQVELFRSVSLSATADIAVSGGVEGGVVEHERSVAIDAVGEVQSSAIFFSVIEAASSITADGLVVVSGLTIRERSASFTATGTIAATAQRDLQRSVSITATVEIDSSGNVPSTGLFERAVAISAIATISVSATLHQPPYSRRVFVVNSEQRVTIVQREPRQYKVDRDKHEEVVV